MGDEEFNEDEFDWEELVEELSEGPTFRVTIAGPRLTLIRWYPTLIPRNCPAGNLFRPREEAGVTIADLTVEQAEAGRELSVTYLVDGGRAAAERRLIRWAGLVGYARVWLPDRVVEPTSPTALGRARVECPSCGQRDRPPRDNETQPMSRPWIVETPFDSADYIARAELPPAEEPERAAPIALFLAGGPLSGKTRMLEHLTARSDPLIPPDAVEVNPCALRARLPELGEGLERRDPRSALSVYEETLHIASLIVTEAVRRRRNLILDGIGAGEPGQFAAQLARMADAGYEVRILLVDAPTDVALERNEERAHRTGFRIDPELVRELHATVSKRFTEWRELPGLQLAMYASQQSLGPE